MVIRNEYSQENLSDWQGLRLFGFDLCWSARGADRQKIGPCLKVFLVVGQDFPKRIDQFGKLLGIIFFDNLPTHTPDYFDFVNGQNFSPDRPGEKNCNGSRRGLDGRQTLYFWRGDPDS
jgi:hypothetical protein